ncbi:MAG: alpha/beta fold hydrolase [Bacteroidia bacterium]|nr:alpha/beta fold hydrolase [Bacteroidia bacterium]
MKLFHRKYGSGPPLIIAHGLYGSSDNWVTVARLLSSYFSVWLIDQRNHGNSPHSSEHNYGLLKNDLLEFMDEQNISSAVLIGHSMGGKTVMYFAKDNPERVSALIVVDILPTSYPAGSINAKEHQLIISSMMTLRLDMVSDRRDAEQKLMEYIRDRRTLRFLLKNLARSKDGRFSWKINLNAISDNMPELLTGFDLGKFDAMNNIMGFPVLFVRGSKSAYIPVESYPVIRRIFPFAEIVTISGAGHWLHAEQPDLFVKNLLYFLSIRE